MRRARLIPLFVSLIIPDALQAQWRLTGEIGGSHLRQSGLPESNALTAGATLDFAGERSLFHSDVLGARTSDDRRTGQWLALGSTTTSSWGAWALQATAVASAFAQSNLRPTTSGDVLVQARTTDDARGVAIGGGGGVTSHNAVAIPNLKGVVDGWWSFGADRFNAEAAVTRTRSVFGESTILVDISRDDINYVDGVAGWHHDAATWSIGANGGLRGRQGSAGIDGWGSAEAALWATSHMAISLTAGRSLEDLVRGVPRARYASVGLRFSALPHLAAFRGSRNAAGPRMNVSRIGDNQRVEVSAIAASRVELTSDFTDWVAIPMERAGRVWRLERSIASGPHRVAIRIDGGEWIVPANLPRIQDDLGGTVGMITVP